MGAALKWILETISAWIQNLATGNSMLVANIDSWSSSLYNALLAGMQAVVLPVAYSIMALFLLLELVHVAQRADANNSTLPAEIIFKVLFKYILVKLAIDSSALILTAIYQVTTSLTFNMGTYLGSIGSAGEVAGIASMADTIEEMSFWSQFVSLIPMLLALLIVGLSVLMAQIIVVARFIEIYVYVTISPVPMATLAGDDLGSIGKSFLKSFTAVCIQGFLIYLVLAFFPEILRTSLFNLGEAEGVGGFLGSLFGIIGYSIVLLIAIFSCKNWSKAICNAM